MSAAALVKMTSRRRSRGLGSVKIFAMSCLFVFFMGNIVMLQSYRSFVAPKSETQGRLLLDSDSGNPILTKRGVNEKGEIRDIFGLYAGEFLPLINQGGKDMLGLGETSQYSVIEGRVRRLMQDNDKDVSVKLENPNVRDGKSLKFEPVETMDIPGRFKHKFENLDPRGVLGSKVLNSRGVSDEMLDCSDVEQISNMKYIGGGWTKAVYRGELRGEEVAVKTVDIGGHEVRKCLDEGGNMTSCYGRAARKIVKEIVLLQALAGENVLKVLGYCVPARQFDGDVDTTVAMVTELGEPIDQIKLLQMSWEDRLKVSYDIIKLVESLSRTRYGSLVLNDFRRTQFVLVNGTLKLSDVDDAGFGEPNCDQDLDCRFKNSDMNTTKESGLGCFNGHCRNHNEFHNIIKTSHHFTSFLLPHGAPKMLRPLIDKLIDKFEKMKVRSAGLLQEISNIVNLYRAGAYLNRGRQDTDYPASPHQDLPGQFDYRCRFSMSGGACTLSVFDLREAQDICDLDLECQGFVWTRRKTWTGRTLIHLKNGKGRPSKNTQTDLYVKPS